MPTTGVTRKRFETCCTSANCPTTRTRSGSTPSSSYNSRNAVVAGSSPSIGSTLPPGRPICPACLRRCGERSMKMTSCGGDVKIAKITAALVQTSGVELDTRNLRRLAALVHHDRALEADHDGPVLVEAVGPHGDDPDVLARIGLAFFQDFALRIDRIAFENRRRKPHLVPAQICHHVHRDIDDTLSGYERERKCRIDKRLAEFGLRRIVVVVVNRCNVLRQQREPHVVRRDHGTAERMSINVADFEILVESAAPTRFFSHSCLTNVRRASFPRFARDWRRCGSYGGRIRRQRRNGRDLRDGVTRIQAAARTGNEHGDAAAESRARCVSLYPPRER